MAKLILGAAVEQIQQEKVLKVTQFVMLASMSLRPRYSLLTLLVVTALVAGGVKLWYGPHHVVERTEPEIEEEYSYLRDWSGDRNIHGIWIRRHFIAEKIYLTQIQYFQYGSGMLKMFFISVEPDGSIRENDFSEPNKFIQLTDHEEQEWKQTVDRERKKLLPFRHEARPAFYYD